MLTIVALALFCTNLQHNQQTRALIIYYCTEYSLLSLGLVAIVVGFLQTRRMSFRSLSEGSSDAFDINLLLVGLFGVLFYMFILVSACELATDGRWEARFFIGKAVLEMSQAILQVKLCCFI